MCSFYGRSSVISLVSNILKWLKDFNTFAHTLPNHKKNMYHISSSCDRYFECDDETIIPYSRTIDTIFTPNSQKKTVKKKAQHLRALL